MSSAMPVEGANFHLEPRQKAEILGAILLALFLFALDQTVVGTALPRIITDLHGENLYTWSVTVYLLTATISGPIYGKLSDLYGRRPIFIWALGLFLLASIGAGLSGEMWQFILFRGLQGLGGGAVFPIALAVIADLYPPEERAKYGAFFGAIFGLSSVLGPTLGGLVTDNLSWHWIFFINAPIAAISLFVCWRLLPPIKHPEVGRDIDYIGAGLFAAAIAPILIGLTNRQTQPSWTDPSVGGAIVAGLAILAVFLWWETRAKDPIVHLALFRNRSFTIAVAGMFLAAFGFFGAVIFLPRWFQVVHGMGATESGLNMLALVGALIVGATVSGQVVARTGHYKWLIFGAMVILAAGLYLMTGLSADTPVPTLWLWMAITGLGIGPSFAVFTVVVQNSVAPKFVGIATASLTFFQQIGGTIGLTLAGVALADSIQRELPPRLLANGVPQQFVDQFSGNPGAAGGQQLDLTGTGDLGARILAQVPAQFQALVQPLIPGIVQAIHEALAVSIGSTFVIGIVAAALAAVFVLFMQEQPMTAAAPSGELVAGPM
ncbi:MAG TPA: MDR family MFS transporter [Candidatus Limnocylindrales bacterium]